jgi:hypothetical protein
MALILGKRITMGEHVAIVPSQNTGLVLSDGMYNVLRALTEKVFPGLGALYATIAAIWGWDYAVQVGGTFAALSVFGGILLTLARRGYVPSVVTDGSFDGAVVEDIVDGESVVRVELNKQGASNILNKEQLLIKGLISN